MKRGTIEHPKTLALMRALKLPKYAAVGILESLWHWTAKYAPRGDIGRFTDEDIAAGLAWDKDASELIQSLIVCRWIDKSGQVRLVVHDWPDHADGAVQKYISRNKLTFYKGDSTSREMSGQVETSPDMSGPPLPLPLPLPLPTTTTAQTRKRKPPFDPLSLLTLETPAPLREAWTDWIRYRTERHKPLTASTAIAQTQRLASWGEKAAIASIRASIEHGWTGLFPPPGAAQEPEGVEPDERNEP